METITPVFQSFGECRTCKYTATFTRRTQSSADKCAQYFSDGGYSDMHNPGDPENHIGCCMAAHGVHLASRVGGRRNSVMFAFISALFSPVAKYDARVENLLIALETCEDGSYSDLFDTDQLSAAFPKLIEHLRKARGE